MLNAFIREQKNPILEHNLEIPWECGAAFNPSVVKLNNIYHMVYRALSGLQEKNNIEMQMSTIGYAQSEDGIHFKKKIQLIKPEYDWEKFGCEDPRITYFNDKFYIFYTALSEFPFTASGIKIALATTKDFKSILVKKPITQFNSKAMALFPGLVNNKMCAILTVHSDIPPAKIAIATFSDESELLSEQYWENWYASLDYHVIPLLRSSSDHVEVGAPPIKTKYGWLIIYSYIKNYFHNNREFFVECALLDLHQPQKIIARTSKPILKPTTHYELNGDVPNVVFPSGALIEDNKIFLYYGASDTTGCLAYGEIPEMIDVLQRDDNFEFEKSKNLPEGLHRYKNNPIISPIYEFAWEAKATFNPGVIIDQDRVHIIYRAVSHDNVSVFGYACSKDGVHIDERLPEPIYVPREFFEKKLQPHYHCGCEDPRITRIDDKIYIFYTAFDGEIPRVAFSEISIEDFRARKWNWAPPKLISEHGVIDKNSCLVTRKIMDKYAIFHRVDNSIYVSYVDDLLFSTEIILKEKMLVPISANRSSIKKVGIAGPPIEIDEGWLLFYHMVMEFDSSYRISAVILDHNDLTKIVSRNDIILLIPEMDYELVGNIPNVVFSCGFALLQYQIYLYYGCADRVIGVAKMDLRNLIKRLMD